MRTADETLKEIIDTYSMPYDWREKKKTRSSVSIFSLIESGFDPNLFLQFGVKM